MSTDREPETDSESEPASEPNFERGDLHPVRLYRAAWILYLVMALVAVVWIGLREGKISLALFCDPRTLPLDGAIGLGVAAALVLFWHLARKVLPLARELERLLVERIGRLESGDVLGLALLSGFAEELLFRGALQRAWGPGWSIALFAILHTGPGRAYRIWTLFALIAGAAFSYLVAWRGNLAAAIVAHVAVNLYQLSQIPRRVAQEP